MKAWSELQGGCTVELITRADDGERGEGEVKARVVCNGVLRQRVWPGGGEKTDTGNTNNHSGRMIRCVFEGIC